MAHRDARHREMMIEWLISMFELTVMKADAIDAREFRTCPPGSSKAPYTPPRALRSRT